VDGFVALTPLLAGVIADHGDPAGIVGFAREARPSDFAALAPRVLGSSDQAAIALTDQAVADVVAGVEHLQAAGAVPVVFLGGLGAYYARALAGRWEMREPLGSVLDGALILAREAV
jgi:glucosamine kinase